MLPSTKNGKTIYNLQEFENKKGHVFIRHEANIGDVMQKTTAQGRHGKVVVTITVDITNA